MKKKSLRHQKGYLAIVAVLLIMVLGFLGVAVAIMTVSGSSAINNFIKAEAALDIAEGGLEETARLLLTPNLTGSNARIACASITSNSNLTNTAIGSGTFTATTVASNPIHASTTLSSALTNSATTIPVASTSGFASAGRITIDNEIINYGAISGANFVGIKRGADGSTAASHASAAPVGQYQCSSSIQGGIPNLTNPVGKRVLTGSIQLEEGWAAGNTLAGPTNWNIAHWNTPTETQWTQQAPAIASPQILNAVSMLSNADAWIVGSQAIALHYNGSTWTKVNTGITGGDNLLTVSAVSSTEAWTASAQGKIYKWTGGSWTNPSTPTNSLNSLSMLDTNGNGTADVGWVVGTKKTAFLYNGTTWTSTNTGISVDLNGVSIVSATDAWAAGLTGKIFQWTGGASWAAITTPSASPTLNSISMIKSGSSDIGWAVGTNSTAWFYNGTSWASSNTGLAASLTLTSVITLSTNEAWVVDSAGHIYEWNGSSWNLIFTSTKALNGIDMLRPNNQPISSWIESFA